MESGTGPGCSFADRLADSAVIAILRGLDPRATAELAAELNAVGANHIEVTIQDPAGEEALCRTVDMIDPHECFLGAGSVTSVGRAERAIELGVQFLVSPGLSPAVVAVADSHGVPILPGVSTPSEVQRAHELGIATVKLFPAAQLGGPGYLRAMSAPFPFMRFVPTGGVDFGNADDYFAAGALAVGIGSELTRPGGVEAFGNCMRGFKGR